MKLKQIFLATAATAALLLAAASANAATAWQDTPAQAGVAGIKVGKAILPSGTTAGLGTEWRDLYTHSGAAIYVSSSESGTPSITITKSMETSGTTGMISTTVGTYAVSGTGKVVVDDIGYARSVKATVAHSGAGAVEVRVYELPYAKQNLPLKAQ